MRRNQTVTDVGQQMLGMRRTGAVLVVGCFFASLAVDLTCADIIKGPYVFEDNAFVDEVLPSFGGPPMLFGGAITVEEAITGSDLGKGVLLLSGDFVDLAFVDNVAINGPGADIVFFEVGAGFPEAIDVTIELDGPTLTVPSVNAGFSEGGFTQAAGEIELSDFGIPFGETISALRIAWPGFDHPAVSGVAALNSALPASDFNGDGLIDCADVDSLVVEIVAGTNNANFDLTGDGFVDTADLDEWRVQGGAANLASGNPYLEGDANLDGTVDGLDFIAWNDNKFTSVAAWCSGDFNAEGTVDGLDYILWNDNKFTSSDSVSAVPEPGAGVFLLVALIGLAVGRRRQAEV